MPSSEERFTVRYHLAGSIPEAHAWAEAICLEQTVELPDDLVADPAIRERVVGKVVSLRPLRAGGFEAVISYAVEIVGVELPQLLNVIFGNTSLQPYIRVAGFDLPASLLQAFRGPRFGRAGWRALLGVPQRPLLCTALKPLGLSPEGLAALAYQVALGGIDLIKDDHGLADQAFCPFEARVTRCVEAVERANQETGLKCSYLPNVTAPAQQLLERALFAKQAGAGGLLIAPGITGLDAMRMLADEDRVALPIMAHPALQGSFVVTPTAGISHAALFGQFARLAGADATVFPNYGGRFAFGEEDCRSLAAATASPLGHLAPIFPTPAGGMSLERVPEMCSFYGNEVIFLIGGGLRRDGPDLVENCRRFRRLVEENDRR